MKTGQMKAPESAREPPGLTVSEAQRRQYSDGSKITSSVKYGVISGSGKSVRTPIER
jgi:hypothetical protein